LFEVTSGRKCREISSLVIVHIGNRWQRRKQTIGVQCRAPPASDTASRLVEVMVEVNVTAVDWLANFNDYRVTTKLRESYEVIKSASKIRIQRFCDNPTAS